MSPHIHPTWQPSEDPSPSLHKEITAILTIFHAPQGLWRVLSPHHANLFEILALASIFFFLALPVFCQQLPIFSEWIPGPFPHPYPHLWFVLCHLAPFFFSRTVTVLVEFFKSIKSVAFSEKREMERECDIDSLERPVQ